MRFPYVGPSFFFCANIYDAVFRKNGSISAKSLNNLTHQVKIPNTFMQRVEVYDKAQYEPNSLFNLPFLTYHFFHEPLLWHPAPTYIADRVW
jgi:hypothetical protein